MKIEWLYIGRGLVYVNEFAYSEVSFNQVGVLK